MTEQEIIDAIHDCEEIIALEADCMVASAAMAEKRNLERILAGLKSEKIKNHKN